MKSANLKLANVKSLKMKSVNMKTTAQKVWLALWIACLLAAGIYEGLFAGRESVYSLDENRMLAGFPEVSASLLMDGSFMEGFEGYLLDRFPKRSRIIRFAQDLRDGVSFAGYADFLAVAGMGDDPLTNQLRPQPEGSPLPVLVSSTLPPKPAPSDPSSPGSQAGSPPESQAGSPPGSQAASPSELAVDPLVDPPRTPVFPSKPEPNAEDFPQSMGLYMQADSKHTALQSYSRSQIIGFTGVLNRFADLLPEGGSLSFTMAPQSSFTNRLVGAAGREALYSDYEPCIYAFSRDNVFVTSTADLLGSAMMQDEYVYFRTDMHWTPYGTHLVYSDMVAAIGFEPTPYEDFEILVEKPFLGTYYRDNPTGYMRDNADELALIKPAAPHEFLRVTAPGEAAAIPLLDENARANDRYTVYLGGPAGPWSILRSDNGMTENCLVLTDSFGLAFVPMLAGQYKEVHYYDPRYFNAGVAGGSVSELIEMYGIKDIFVVVGDLHSFNSDFIYQAAAQLG
ncbi:MAG: hypothetical protein LBH09_01530 [Peptococcaceae bacterium]|nr:hypothetical protein [Peptococcaceae bacterium]